MIASNFRLNRLRVLCRGVTAYDQKFHAGLNVIRGENGSGKSTIADFIFYAFGGEFQNWKTAASHCDEIQAEIITKGGILSIKRQIAKAQTPISVFYGPMSVAEQNGLDGWHLLPIRRSAGNESFSQILFRSAGIPEAQSQGAANITMNQLLRLLYSDQRTPAGFLFKYESFDTKEIREAVGSLVCGVSGYELYEIELKLRELSKKYDEKEARLSALLDVLPANEAVLRQETLEENLKVLDHEIEKIRLEILSVDEFISADQTQHFIKERKVAADLVRSERDEIAKLEQEIHVTNHEIADIQAFVVYLEDLARKLKAADASAGIIGNIDFVHCPACLTPLTEGTAATHCILCGTETDPEKEKARYLQVKLDVSIQARESRQLLEEKESSLSYKTRELRELRHNYQERLSDYSAKYDVSTSPRESFLAGRNQRLGQIDRERTALSKLRERTIEIEKLSLEKANLQREISILRDEEAGYRSAREKRRRIALTSVSDHATAILRQDLERQVEFRNSQNVELNFADNSILVDGELNFAESSNVIVKNAAILSLFLAATKDSQFFHPRFILLDSIEDKGMEQARSHNFQEIIQRASEGAQTDHQIIITTSMFNSNLGEECTVGPHYDHENRTLNIGVLSEADSTTREPKLNLTE